MVCPGLSFAFALGLHLLYEARIDRGILLQQSLLQQYSHIQLKATKQLSYNSHDLSITTMRTERAATLPYAHRFLEL